MLGKFGQLLKIFSDSVVKVNIDYLRKRTISGCRKMTNMSFNVASKPIKFITNCFASEHSEF